MIYDLSKPIDRQNMKLKLIGYLNGNNVVELKLRRKERTISQNKYLHVIIDYFGSHFGYTTKEAKEFLKKESNLLYYEKKGRKFLKSTSELDTKEMSDFIEWIITFSAKQGLYIPSSKEYLEDQVRINREIHNNRQYLNQ